MTISWILLCFLLVLHIFWFILFQKMNYLALCKGEVRDIQNDVVKKKKEEMDQELKDK